MPSLARCAAATPSSAAACQPSSKPQQKKMIDMISDDSYMVDYGDSTIFILVGNFAAHHNGAVILADSAVRYGNQSFECFGNVLINQNTTYIYGDRAEYNRDLNRATVYSRSGKDRRRRRYDVHLQLHLRYIRQCRRVLRRLLRCQQGTICWRPTEDTTIPIRTI